MLGFAFMVMSVLFVLLFGFSDHFRTTMEWVFSIQVVLFSAWTILQWYIKRASKAARQRAIASVEKIRAADAARREATAAEIRRPKTDEELDAEIARLRARLGYPSVSTPGTQDAEATEKP